MSRRTILRARPAITTSPDQARRQQRLRAKAQKAQAAVDRWWRRLCRAMVAVQKHQKELARLRKQLDAPNP